MPPEESGGSPTKSDAPQLCPDAYPIWPDEDATKADEYPTKVADYPAKVANHPIWLDGPQLSPHLYPSKIHLYRKSRDKERMKIGKHRTTLSSYLMSSDKEET